MSASVVVVLDRTAPVIEWGAVDGTTAGELLQVAYTTSEPATVTRASVRLADGRALAMTDLGGVLQVLLPADTADGWASISARAVDDVGNARTSTLSVRLTGTIIPVPPTPPAPVGQPGGPAPARPEPRPLERRRTVTSHSIARAVTETSTRAVPGGAVSATAVAGSALVVRVTRTPGVQAASTVTSTWSRSLPRRSIASSATVDAAITIRRGDGPDIEAMIGLGLLL